MKIGPNHDSGALNRPNQESAKLTQGKPECADPAAGGKENPGPVPIKQPTDTLHLSGLSGPSSERVGYDSHELRDRLAVARSQSKDRLTDIEGSGETDSVRLDTIRQLIESGFYEREEVKQQIAGKLADEFIGGDPDQGDS